MTYCFEPAYFENIPAPFRQVEKILHQGFGVGLTLVQKIIQLHHGKIELNSSQKLGTRVNLEFPLAKF
jgi:signal transduction histidine kinase